ncbi:MAG: alpha/beta fold hydrolase, partial [Solirubrobacteraceae bacterium]
MKDFESSLAGSGPGAPRIFWRSWTPQDDLSPDAVIVLVHGAGEHSGRYEHVAAALTGAGAAVYAPDHRGHGRSDGPRALIDRVDHALADIDAVVS